MAAALLTGFTIPITLAAHSSSARSLVTCKHRHRWCRSSSPSSAPATTRSSPSATDPSSPTSAATSPTPAATSPTPAPTSTGTTAACVTSTAQGQCGPYDYPADTASSGFNTYVGQDVFSPVSGWSQTLSVTDPGNWHVNANMPAGNTAVVGFPSVGQGSSGDGVTQKISAYTTITSTFAEDMHANPGTDAEAAYDIWTAAGTETMIQFDFSALRPRCSAGPATRCWPPSASPSPAPAGPCRSGISANLAPSGSGNCLAGPSSPAAWISWLC